MPKSTNRRISPGTMKTDKPKLRYGDHARVQHGLLSDEEAQPARVEKGVAKERAKKYAHCACRIVPWWELLSALSMSRDSPVTNHCTRFIWPRLCIALVETNRSSGFRVLERYDQRATGCPFDRQRRPIRLW
jgi:hypothetical protein